MFAIAIPALVLLPALVYSFVLGVQAFKESGRQSGEYAMTLRFLGLNLCEPLINTYLIIFLLYQYYGWEHLLFLVNLPMIVLTIPALGLWFSDPFYRDKSKQILLLGLGRWGINILILLCLGVEDFGGVDVLLFLIPLNLGLLWESIRWGKKHLDGRLCVV